MNIIIFFLRAHNLWTALTIEFVQVFIDTSMADNSPEYLFALLHLTFTHKGLDIMNLIIENKYLNELIKQIEDNLTKALGHIKSYDNDENLS